MSVPVPLAALAERIVEFGSVAFLITTGESAGPHTVSVTVGWEDGDLTTTAGGRTSANVALHPSVTLLWPPPAEGPYALIVDAEAHVRGGGPGQAPAAIVLRPMSAVLHRIAGADPDLPSCVRL